MSEHDLKRLRDPQFSDRSNDVFAGERDELQAEVERLRGELAEARRDHGMVAVETLLATEAERDAAVQRAEQFGKELSQLTATEERLRFDYHELQDKWATALARAEQAEREREDGIALAQMKQQATSICLAECQQMLDATKARLEQAERERLRAENRRLRDILNRSYRLQKMHTEALQRHLLALGVPTMASRKGATT